MTEKEKAKAAAEIAKNLWLDSEDAKAALIEAAGGTPRPASMGEDCAAPAPGVFDLFWAGELLSRLPTAPNLSASKSPLKAARDRGCVEAGEVFEIVGDGAALPDLPAEVIEAAAVWAVTYIDRRIETAPPGSRLEPGHYDKRRRSVLIEDLFLRAVGARRVRDRCEAGACEYQAAAFFRRMFDLGGQA